MEKKIVVILLTLISCFLFSQNKLPSISLQNLNGEKVAINSLDSNKNPIILSFWATWCMPCIKELSTINDVYEDWQDETNVELIAISVDDSRTLKRVKPMVNGKSWEYEVLLDQNQELKRAFNVITVPHTFIIYKNEIIYNHSGYTPGTEEELYDTLIKHTR
ncbi:sporulation thiol-disulfide oxidoreductase [Flavobacteriaceae bacterium UJ101]|nr:sporulation thiol-disulfide oxidoreductase [Flavobacteriaceae bacterium UJ101]